MTQLELLTMITQGLIVTAVAVGLLSLSRQGPTTQPVRVRVDSRKR